MIVKCEKCGKRFEDEFRRTICPHDTFLANDGQNNFTIYHDAHLEDGGKDGDRT